MTLTAFILLPLVLGAAPAQPAATPPTPPAAPPASARNPDITSADELLSALERADQDLRTFESLIQYTRVAGDLQGGDQHVRRGRLWFASEPPADPAARARRRFEVSFTELIFDGRKRDDVEEWIFDGLWLVERRPTDKQFIKRRVIKPGEDKDPLRIGEGPFPIPVGQKKADVLARFDAALVDPLDALQQNESLRKLLSETYQLRLTPRDGVVQTRDFREVRLWYQRKDLLPIFAVATNTDGSRSEVFLLKQVKNGPIGPERFRTDEPRPEDGWVVQIEDFRPDGPAPGQNPSIRTPGTTIKP